MKNTPTQLTGSSGRDKPRKYIFKKNTVSYLLPGCLSSLVCITSICDSILGTKGKTFCSLGCWWYYLLWSVIAGKKSCKLWHLHIVHKQYFLYFTACFNGLSQAVRTSDSAVVFIREVRAGCWNWIWGFWLCLSNLDQLVTGCLCYSMPWITWRPLRP